MSALGQKQTSARGLGMSALTPKADKPLGDAFARFFGEDRERLWLALRGLSCQQGEMIR
jgi:hypothetical protein